MIKIKYNTEIYNFREIISKLFDYDDLSKLHNKTDFTELITQSVKDTHKFQQSKYHQIYYNNFELMEPVYLEFLKNVVKPIYNGEKIVYQKKPTFRIHFPNGMSVGMFHKDKDLRDYSWHELIKEDNFYLPITNSYGTNTIWAETEEDKNDFQPMVCDYGEIIKWDGTNLKHGNKINTTNDTRISIDFRVTTESKFKNSENNTKNGKTNFTIGGYYNIL